MIDRQTRRQRYLEGIERIRQRLAAKALPVIERYPGINLANLAMKLGIAPYSTDGRGRQKTSQFEHLEKAVYLIADVRVHPFASAGDFPNIYPLGYEEKSDKAVRQNAERPCRVYRPGDQDYERIYAETVRKSA